MKKNQDIYAGLAIIAFAILMYTQALKLSEMQSVYPKVLLITMMIAGVCITVSSVVKQKKTGVVFKKITLQFLKNEALLPGAYLLVMVLLIKPLGLYVVSFLTILGLCMLEDFIGKRMDKVNLKHILSVALVALVFTAVMYLMFNIVLKLPTPTGIFGF